MVSAPSPTVGPRWNRPVSSDLATWPSVAIPCVPESAQVRFPVGAAPRPVVSVLEGSTPQPPQLVDDSIQALTLD